MAKTTAIAIALLMTASIVLISEAVQPAQAQLAATQPTSGPMPAGATADFTVTVTPYLSVRPNPVGINQQLLINIWNLPAPNAHRNFKDMKLTITKPDGTQEVLTMNSYPADGTAWLEYVVDQIGDWKFKYDFPGMYFPAGRYLDGNVITATSGGTVYTSAYYSPSSTKETTITVQGDMVWSWPAAPLPTDYWTHPISFDNREWWTIAGNYPWHGPSGGSAWNELYPETTPFYNDRSRFTPWVQGPNTAHIAWKRQENLGGLLQFGDYMGPFTLTVSVGIPNIIYMGRCYQSLTKTIADGSTASVLQCYDIRTGEVYWERTGVSAPTVIEYDRGTPETAGGEARQMGNTGNVNLLYIGGGRLLKYSPATGALIGNYSIDPLTGNGGTYYMNGYVLGIQNLGTSVPADQRYRLINWTTIGSSSTLTARVKGNTSYARSSFPSINDWYGGVGATTSKSMVSGAPNMTTVTAFSLWTGQQLWSTAVDEWTYSGSCAVADHGKIAVLMEQGYWMAWDENTGNLMWKSERMNYPWGEPAFGGYTVQSAYGMLFRQSYDGIYAVDWDTGKTVWKYVAPAVSPFETPYTDVNGGQTVYSFDSHGNIVDGKMYVLNNEHTPTSPITRGWGVHCINITTGELVWKMMGPWTWSAPGPAADGYLTVPSADGCMYVFGKGKSATTVTAPDVMVPKGNGVLVRGTVVDLSPAQPNTPCVSKESMSTQMEYLHTQHPIDGIYHNLTMTGVPVALTAIDESNNYIDIGVATTSAYYGTFEMAWTPPNEGTYRIIASFAGDDSYSSSAASTAISVGPAAAQITIPEQQTPPDYTMTIVGVAIAIMIVVVLVGVVLYRKK
jgi:PQQ-like domain